MGHRGSAWTAQRGDEDAFLFEYAANGTLLATHVWNGSRRNSTPAQNPASMTPLPRSNSGVVVLGNYRDGNIFLAKFSAEGTLIWDLTWGFNQEAATAVAVAPDGTFYVTGGTYGLHRRTGRCVSFEVYGNRDAQLAAHVGRRLHRRRAALLLPPTAASPSRGPELRVGESRCSALRFWRQLRVAPRRWAGLGSAQDVAVGADGSLHITGNVLTEPSGADAFVLNVLANGKGHDAAVWVVAIRSMANALRRSQAAQVARLSSRDLPAHLRSRSVVDRRTRSRQTRSSRVCGHRHGTCWSRGSIGGRGRDPGGQRDLRRLVGLVSPSHSTLRHAVDILR